MPRNKKNIYYVFNNRFKFDMLKGEMFKLWYSLIYAMQPLTSHIFNKDQVIYPTKKCIISSFCLKLYIDEGLGKYGFLQDSSISLHVAKVPLYFYIQCYIVWIYHNLVFYWWPSWLFPGFFLLLWIILRNIFIYRTGQKCWQRCQQWVDHCFQFS